MTEEEAQMMVSRAIIEEKNSTIRMLHKINMTLYGHHRAMIDMLRAGKVNEVIDIMEASCKTCEDRLING
jgi:hypothetical protein